MIHISASLLAADFARLGEEMQRAVKAGVDSFHFDMMDGHYVPNIALAPYHLSALRKYTGLPFHLHLELSNPHDVLNKFQPLQADLVIACHDTLPYPSQIMNNIHNLGMRAGLSLNPDEPLDTALPFFTEIDLLLILGVFPGFGGQIMQAGTIEKVAQARREIQAQGLDLPIAVDGGVNLHTAPELVWAGANILIIGTALFQSKTMDKVIKDLKDLPVD